VGVYAGFVLHTQVHEAARKTIREQAERIANLIDGRSADEHLLQTLKDVSQLTGL